MMAIVYHGLIRILSAEKTHTHTHTTNTFQHSESDFAERVLMYVFMTSIKAGVGGATAGKITGILKMTKQGQK